MKQLLSFLCFVFGSLSPVIGADNNTEIWNKANALFQQKQYDSAIIFYQKIIEQQPQNEIAHYNLGNAFYKSHQISNAVLHYERALFYNPQNHNAKENLFFIKSQIPKGIKENKSIFFVQWWTTATARNTASLWAIISLILFLGFMGIIFWSIVMKTRKSIPNQAFIIIPFVILLFLFFAFTSANNATRSNKAVVMSGAGIMTTSPNIYKGQTVIPEATTVETGAVNGKWIAVTLPDKRTGWMQISDLALVHSNNKK